MRPTSSFRILLLYLVKPLRLLVTIIKDLKVKGTSKVAKVGTKVRINRLIDEDHDIDCKIDGIGAMKLKTMFVKKA